MYNIKYEHEQPKRGNNHHKFVAFEGANKKI